MHHAKAATPKPSENSNAATMSSKNLMFHAKNAQARQMITAIYKEVKEKEKTYNV